MIRWFIVRAVAWALRSRPGHNHPRMNETEVRDALIRAFPHRNVVWRTEIIEDAEQRNRARLLRKIHA